MGVHLLGRKLWIAISEHVEDRGRENRRTNPIELSGNKPIRLGWPTQWFLGYTSDAQIVAFGIGVPLRSNGIQKVFRV